MVVIHVASRFHRSFKKMPDPIRENFSVKITLFIKDPFNPSLKTHKLKGNLGSYYAFHLREGYRVLFEFQDTNNVLMVNIGSHDDYSKWEKG